MRVVLRTVVGVEVLGLVALIGGRAHHVRARGWIHGWISTCWSLVPIIAIILENVVPRALGGKSTWETSETIVGCMVVSSPAIIIPEVATGIISPTVAIVVVVSVVSTGLVHIVIVGFALRILKLSVLIMVVATTSHIDGQ